MSTNGAEHCPNCEGTNVVSELTPTQFLYGEGPEPVLLEADVLVFTCDDCKESWTGEQAEAAQSASVAMYRLEIFPQLCVALKAQHEAIDHLFALLVAKTMHAEQPFYPSECGQPWVAIQLGKKAIEMAGGVV